MLSLVVGLVLGEVDGRLKLSDRAYSWAQLKVAKSIVAKKEKAPVVVEPKKEETS